MTFSIMGLSNSSNFFHNLVGLACASTMRFKENAVYP